MQCLKACVIFTHMKEDVLEILAHWIEDINLYLELDGIPIESLTHDINRKLFKMRMEVKEILESTY